MMPFPQPFNINFCSFFINIIELHVGASLDMKEFHPIPLQEAKIVFGLYIDKLFQ